MFKTKSRFKNTYILSLWISAEANDTVGGGDNNHHTDYGGKGRIKEGKFL